MANNVRGEGLAATLHCTKTYGEVAELASSSSHLMYCSYNFVAFIELAINMQDESLHGCLVAIVLHICQPLSGQQLGMSDQPLVWSDINFVMSLAKGYN